MSTNESSVPRRRRPKKILSPSAKYGIWLQLVRGEATIAQAATQAGVDRSTIIRVRQVAKDRALAALAASKLGSPGESARGVELEQAHAEIERLGEAVKVTLLKKGVPMGFVKRLGPECGRVAGKGGCRCGAWHAGRRRGVEAGRSGRRWVFYLALCLRSS